MAKSNYLPLPKGMHPELKELVLLERERMDLIAKKISLRNWSIVFLILSLLYVFMKGNFLAIVPAVVLSVMAFRAIKELRRLRSIQYTWRGGPVTVGGVMNV